MVDTDYVVVRRADILVRRADGHHAWAVLAGWVVCWDLYAWLSGRQTLSACFHRQLERTFGRRLIAVGWIALTFHLFFWEGARPLRSAPVQVDDLLG